jgi:adenylate cyclase
VETASFASQTARLVAGSRALIGSSKSLLQISRGSAVRTVFAVLRGRHLLDGCKSAPSLRDTEIKTGPPNGVTPEASWAQLQRILTSQQFDASDRNRRFLAYVVEETLAGRSERIKGYSIATAVFGRQASFDPQTDPIIRIEASRLRRSLERYYLTAGRLDPVRIDIPKGTYVPRFRAEVADLQLPGMALQEDIDSISATPGFPVVDAVGSGGNRVVRRFTAATGLLVALLSAWLGTAWFGQYPPFSAERQSVPAVRIFIAPFENDGGDAVDLALIRGFTREVTIGLSRFGGLFVYGSETGFIHGAAGGAKPAIQDMRIDYVLTGGVTASQDRLRVAVSLIDARTGRYLWSDILEQGITAGDVSEVRKVLAQQIARTFARSSGILLNEGPVRNEAISASFVMEWCSPCGRK